MNNFFSTILTTHSSPTSDKHQTLTCNVLHDSLFNATEKENVSPKAGFLRSVTALVEQDLPPDPEGRRTVLINLNKNLSTLFNFCLCTNIIIKKNAQSKLKI